jgi:hypothetical protein
MKKEIMHGVGAGNVEARATRDDFPPPFENKKKLDDGDALGFTGTL